MLFFKILWCVDAVAAGVILYFFFAGVADGTVNGRNESAWLLIIGAIGAVMIGSIYLRTHGHSVLSLLTVLLPAIPSLLFIIYFSLAVLNKERWN